jgi:hypothetical protein
MTTFLEPVEAAPRPDHGLLHGIFRVENRTQHSVEVADQLGPVCLQSKRRRLVTESDSADFQPLHPRPLVRTACAVCALWHRHLP